MNIHVQDVKAFGIIAHMWFLTIFKTWICFSVSIVMTGYSISMLWWSKGGLYLMKLVIYGKMFDM